MKVRFYRGPYDGKTMDVSPGILGRGPLKVLHRKMKKPSGPNATIMDWHVSGEAYYDIKMMGCTLNGVDYCAPAMHPDGSLILEWTQPRGSKMTYGNL